jgi:hypothetical protein
MPTADSQLTTPRTPVSNVDLLSPITSAATDPEIVAYRDQANRFGQQVVDLLERWISLIEEYIQLIRNHDDLQQDHQALTDRHTRLGQAYNRLLHFHHDPEGARAADARDAMLARLAALEAASQAGENEGAMGTGNEQGAAEDDAEADDERGTDSSL